MSRTGLFGAALLSAGLAWGHEGPAPAPAPAGGAAAVAQPLASGGTRDARTYFTDTEFTDQHGRRVRFYSDALEGRVVLINVIYTNCKDACPLITRRLDEVRARLGERFGREVHFVSISSDPEHDTPEALRAFAQKHKVDVEGWHFLTGTRAAIDVVLGRLGTLSESAENHSTLLLAGNVPAKRWSKIRPDAPPAAIAERMLLLADGTGAR